MNRYDRKLAAVLACMLLLLPGLGTVRAESGNKMTSNHAQSVISGKKAVFCGYTTDLYRFKFNGGSENFWSMLTDGILADSTGNSQLNQIYSSGTGRYSVYGTNFVLIYDLEKYYDLASVALYSFHSDNQNDTVWEWDVYASDKKSDLLTVSKMQDGKKGFDDPADLQIPVYFRHVRYLAFAMRTENPSGLLKLSEIEAFGVPSRDQDTASDHYIYDIADGAVRVTAESSSFSSDLDLSVSADLPGADQEFLSGLGYFYKIHKTFQIAVSGAELASGTKYTVKLPVPAALRQSSELCVAQKNEQETVLISADLQGGYAVLTTYSLGEFALVEPNYTSPYETAPEESEASGETVPDSPPDIGSGGAEQPSKAETKPAEAGDSSVTPWLIGAGAAVVLAAGVAAALLVIRKKRSKKA